MINVIKYHEEKGINNFSLRLKCTIHKIDWSEWRRGYETHFKIALQGCVYRWLRGLEYSLQ